MLHVGEQVMSTTTFSPFKRFVRTLYKKRLAYQARNDQMQAVVKLLMNSLYGKFGQRTDDKETIQHIDDVQSIIMDDEIAGNYVIRKVSNDRVPKFVNPILSAYVTGYARLHLTRLLRKHHALYCDTDSLITYDTLSSTKDFGGLKLEEEIQYGILIKPKMYRRNELVKVKGFSKATTHAFEEFMSGRSVPYEKFLKFKECNRRIDEERYLNQPVLIHKHYSLEDDKRVWIGHFDPRKLQDSAPIHLPHTTLLPKSINRSVVLA
jgi:hypothetical protein